MISNRGQSISQLKRTKKRGFENSTKTFWSSQTHLGKRQSHNLWDCQCKDELEPWRKFGLSWGVYLRLALSLVQLRLIIINFIMGVGLNRFFQGPRCCQTHCWQAGIPSRGCYNAMGSIDSPSVAQECPGRIVFTSSGSSLAIIVVMKSMKMKGNCHPSHTHTPALKNRDENSLWEEKIAWVEGLAETNTRCIYYYFYCREPYGSSNV